MELYKRIKQRREELNLSQDDLAKRLGYRSRSTIAKIESGANDIPQSKIAAFSKALDVNEAWLMGLDTSQSEKNTLSNILEERIKTLGISYDDVAEKAGVSAHWLKNIDTFTPGGFGEYEIGYEWITKVAKVLELSGSELRSALARQEIPLPDNNFPRVSAKDAFGISSTDEDNKSLIKPQIVNISESGNSSFAVPNLLTKYVSKLNERGISKVTDYAKDLSFNPLYQQIRQEIILNAAHERTDVEITEEMIQHDDDIMDDENF